MILLPIKIDNRTKIMYFKNMKHVKAFFKLGLLTYGNKFIKSILFNYNTVYIK